MLLSHEIAQMFAFAVLGCGFNIVAAQDYPIKPIRILTAEPGGTSDLLARATAQGISGSLGQSIVENRGTQVIAIETVARAVPDGYTAVVAASNFWITPLLDKTSYDPLNDFSAITMLARQVSVLVVHPSLPVKSVRELVVLARAKPGSLNYASTITGATIHLATELFKSMAGVDIVRIPYKGTNQGLSDLLSGEVQVMLPPTSAATPHIKSGRLRPLAVTSAQPSALFPGLPTIAETVPGYESTSLYAMFVPAKTPEAIVNRLSQETIRALTSAEFKAKLLSGGVEVVAASPAQTVVTMKSEMARMGKLIRDAGIKAN